MIKGYGRSTWGSTMEDPEKLAEDIALVVLEPREPADPAEWQAFLHQFGPAKLRPDGQLKGWRDFTNPLNKRTAFYVWNGYSQEEAKAKAEQEMQRGAGAAPPQGPITAVAVPEISPVYPDKPMWVKPEPTPSPPTLAVPPPPGAPPAEPKPAEGEPAPPPEDETSPPPEEEPEQTPEEETAESAPKAEERSVKYQYAPPVRLPISPRSSPPYRQPVPAWRSSSVPPPAWGQIPQRPLASPHYGPGPAAVSGQPAAPPPVAVRPPLPPAPARSISIAWPPPAQQTPPTASRPSAWRTGAVEPTREELMRRRALVLPPAGQAGRGGGRGVIGRIPGMPGEIGSSGYQLTLTSGPGTRGGTYLPPGLGIGEKDWQVVTPEEARQAPFGSLASFVPQDWERMARLELADERWANLTDAQWEAIYERAGAEAERRLMMGEEPPENFTAVDYWRRGQDIDRAYAEWRSKVKASRRLPFKEEITNQICFEIDVLTLALGGRAALSTRVGPLGKGFAAARFIGGAGAGPTREWAVGTAGAPLPASPPEDLADQTAEAAFSTLFPLTSIRMEYEPQRRAAWAAAGQPWPEVLKESGFRPPEVRQVTAGSEIESMGVHEAVLQWWGEGIPAEVIHQTMSGYRDEDGRPLSRAAIAETMWALSGDERRPLYRTPNPYPPGKMPEGHVSWGYHFSRLPRRYQPWARMARRLRLPDWRIAELLREREAWPPQQ